MRKPSGMTRLRNGKDEEERGKPKVRNETEE